MSLLRNQRNSKKQGDVGLGIAIGWFSSRGYHVSVPLTDSQDYDLVVEADGRFFSVQVKTTYHQKYPGIYCATLKVSGGNRSGTGKVKYFDPKRIHYLFILTERGDMYLIPSYVVTNRTSINLGEQYQEFRVTWGDLQVEEAMPL